MWTPRNTGAGQAPLLVLKAKLEAVEAGLTTLEQEFLAGMVLPGDTMVSEALLPRLEGHEHRPDARSAARRRGYPAAAHEVNIV